MHTSSVGSFPYKDTTLNTGRYFYLKTKEEDPAANTIALNVTFALKMFFFSWKTTNQGTSIPKKIKCVAFCRFVDVFTVLSATWAIASSDNRYQVFEPFCIVD